MQLYIYIYIVYHIFKFWMKFDSAHPDHIFSLLGGLALHARLHAILDINKDEKGLNSNLLSKLEQSSHLSIDNPVGVGTKPQHPRENNMAQNKVTSDFRNFRLPSGGTHHPNISKPQRDHLWLRQQNRSTAGQEASRSVPGKLAGHKSYSSKKVGSILAKKEKVHVYSEFSANGNHLSKLARNWA